MKKSIIFFSLFIHSLPSYGGKIVLQEEHKAYENIQSRLEEHPAYISLKLDTEEKIQKEQTPFSAELLQLWRVRDSLDQDIQQLSDQLKQVRKNLEEQNFTPLRLQQQQELKAALAPLQREVDTIKASPAYQEFLVAQKKAQDTANERYIQDKLMANQGSFCRWTMQDEVFAQVDLGIVETNFREKEKRLLGSLEETLQKTNKAISGAHCNAYAHYQEHLFTTHIDPLQNQLRGLLEEKQDLHQRIKELELQKAKIRDQFSSLLRQEQQNIEIRLIEEV